MYTYMYNGEQIKFILSAKQKDENVLTYMYINRQTHELLTIY